LLKAFTNDKELYSTMNYPMQNDIKFIMGGSNSFWDIHTHFEQMQTAFGDRQHDLGVFFENHDNQRFLWDHPDFVKMEAALTLVHTWIGIPILYYGAEQDLTGSFDPDCRRPLWNYGYNEQSPRFKHIQKLNLLRTKFSFDTLDQREVSLDDHHYAFTRGNKMMVVLSNLGTGGYRQNYRLQTPFNSNQQVCDFLTGECVNVGGDGKIDVELNNG
jgi:alpha-amylase